MLPKTRSLAAGVAAALIMASTSACSLYSDTDGPVSSTSGLDAAGSDAGPDGNDQCRESTEECDGIDNDCDGAIDEECSCAYADTDQGVCQNGRQDPETGSCSPPDDYENVESLCDGKDNDCDGTVDPGCRCVDGEDGTCFSGKDKFAGVGECSEGTRSCTDGMWDECVGDVLPAQETCDGKDNNCDGAVDEGCPCDYNDTSVGLCSKGTVAQDGSCSAPDGYEEDEANCDQQDNDCDGTVDEGGTQKYTEDFEGKNNDWYDYDTGADTATVDADATDRVHGGSQSGTASHQVGVCGDDGLARDFDLAGQPQQLSAWINGTTSNYGRTSIMIADSSGVDTLWRKKASGSAYDLGWTKKTFDISGYDKSFTLIFGNDDDSKFCTAGDHTWTMWVDDVTVTQSCK